MADDIEDLAFEDLPDDPEHAFLMLERQFREACEEEIEYQSRQNAFPTEAYLGYIGRVLAATSALEIDILTDWSTPSAVDFETSTYQDFRRDVDHYITGLRIRLTRRTKGNSVHFDLAAKSKIRHLLEKIRDTVDHLDISERKREALFARINALQKEVDRNRSRFESLGALMVEIGGFAGRTAEEAEPARKWLHSISEIFHGAREQEGSVGQLPGPAETKRIEPPRKRIEPPRNNSESADSRLNPDDIPF